MSSGLQSAFRESIGSVLGFRSRFASQSVQFGASERVSQVNWFRSGLQIGFRESIGSVRGFRARFASHLIQFGASERVSRVNCALHTHTHTLSLSLSLTHTHTHTERHTHTHKHTHSHTQTQTHTHTFSLSLTQTHTHCQTHTLKHTHTQTHKTRFQIRCMICLTKNSTSRSENTELLCFNASLMSSSVLLDELIREQCKCAVYQQIRAYVWILIIYLHEKVPQILYNQSSLFQARQYRPILFKY